MDEILKSNDIDEIWKLVDKYTKKKKYKQLHKIYERLIKLGDTIAIHNLGILYQFGRGVKQDSLKAIEYYKKAIKSGNDDPIWDIINIYYLGIGVKKDIIKAYELLKKYCYDDEDIINEFLNDNGKHLINIIELENKHLKRENKHLKRENKILKLQKNYNSIFNNNLLELICRYY